jgi:antitoxin component of MazEF toxin-antitoxin module
MTKKLTPLGEDLALVIDKSILDTLGLTEKTELDLIIMDDMLLVKSKKTNAKSSSLEQTAASLMDKYESVFKKLAKT